MKIFRQISVSVVVFLAFQLSCFASDVSIYIDNRKIEFDVPPVIQNDRTLVPMRKIFEELGCNVEWLSETQTVIATRNNKVIALQIGKNKIITNDIETGKSTVTEIDTAPIIHNNRTLVPVRVISENLGCRVDWDEYTKTVTITDNSE